MVCSILKWLNIFLNKQKFSSRKNNTQIMKNITVIGAGTMGNGIAHAFAQKDFNVNLVDISSDALERALVNIEKNLEQFQRLYLLHCLHSQLILQLTFYLEFF